MKVETYGWTQPCDYDTAVQHRADFLTIGAQAWEAGAKNEGYTPIEKPQVELKRALFRSLDDPYTGRLHAIGKVKR